MSVVALLQRAPEEEATRSSRTLAYSISTWSSSVLPVVVALKFSRWLVVVVREWGMIVLLLGSDDGGGCLLQPVKQSGGHKFCRRI